MQLPAFFMALAGVTLVLALVALWQSLRSVLGAEAPAPVGLGGAHRGALEDEKNVLLRAIKDLSFERDLGKISEADFQKLDAAYRQRAKEVLRLLDEGVEPFLAEASKLVDAATATPKVLAREAGKKGKGKKKKREPIREAPSDEPRTAEPERPEVEGDETACPSCGTTNEADALHCKSCAARLAPQTCAACETVNDPDAKFCKKCAARLGAPEQATAEGSDE